MKSKKKPLHLKADILKNLSEASEALSLASGCRKMTKVKMKKKKIYIKNY